MVEPRMTVKLGTQSTGIISRMLVDRGDRLEAGQPVAELDSTIERHNTRIASERAANDSEIRLAEAAAEFEDGRLTRRSSLMTKNVIAKETFEKADTDARMRASELERAQAAQRLARLEADRAAAILAMRTVRSPIKGVVVARKMSPGEFVRDESVLVEIAAIDPLYVNVYLPSELFTGIRVGLTARVRLEEAIGGSFVSAVTLKDPVIDAASSMFLVRLELPNPDGVIPSGVRCTIEFDAS
jgi:RND family efflux transporter MFP subunit